jgi:hypothetical protein
MTIRELEFSILRLRQQLDELINATQYTIIGKLPVNLINPNTLHNILKNLQLHLLCNYELNAGTRRENIYLCYDFVTVTAFVDAHHIKIILNVPSKTANRHFVLCKIFTLPTRVANATVMGGGHPTTDTIT